MSSSTELKARLEAARVERERREQETREQEERKLQRLAEEERREEEECARRVQQRADEEEKRAEEERVAEEGPVAEGQRNTTDAVGRRRKRRVGVGKRTSPGCTRPRWRVVRGMTKKSTRQRRIRAGIAGIGNWCVSAQSEFFIYFSFSFY